MLVVGRFSGDRMPEPHGPSTNNEDRRRDRWLNGPIQT